MKLQIKILDPKIREKMPSYASAGSAGLDLRAVIDEPLVLRPSETKLIKTGLAIYIGDPGYAALILPRSGLINTASCSATWSDLLIPTIREN